MLFFATNVPDGVDYAASLEQAMSAPALLFTAILAFFVFSPSRATALTAIIAAVCYLPQTETLNLGFHFYAIRLVLLAGIARVFIRGEHRGFKPGRIDKAVLIYIFVIFTIASLRAPGELTIRLGSLYDSLLGYFVFRLLLKGEADFRLTLEKTAYLIVPFALLMLYESITNHNFFSLFHGVDPASWIRNGSTRAQGPFRNPITAGSFGTTFAMLFASLRFSGTRKSFVLIGLIASGLIIFSSHSSGPFLGLALGLASFFIWPLRSHLKQILWGIVSLFLFLSLFMNAPVWFLIGRIGDVTGGGGYHRSMLIEQTIRHFDRWWLAGTNDTFDWFPYSINGGADITNFFIRAAVDAGLAGLFVALALVARCFKTLGQAITTQPGLFGPKLLWGLGATLVGTIGILFSVTYMDQMQTIFYFFIASIAALAVPLPATFRQPVLVTLPRKKAYSP